MRTPIDKRLMDDAVSAYADWRKEVAAVTAAYEQWSSAPAADSGLAFMAYRAALDREEHASRLYGGLMTQIAEAVPEAKGPHAAVDLLLLGW